MITSVSKQYAKALFELTSDSNKEKYYQDLIVLKEALLEEETIKVFAHPSITLDQKKEIIANSLQDKLDTTLLNFLYVLINYERLNTLEGIAESYKELLDEELKQKEVQVYCKYHLTKEQTEELINILQKQYNKTIILQEILDKSLVGGIKVVVGNEELDASTLNKLQKIKDTLKG